MLPQRPPPQQLWHLLSLCQLRVLLMSLPLLLAALETFATNASHPVACTACSIAFCKLVIMLLARALMQSL
jgi:hypothetical protein